MSEAGDASRDPERSEGPEWDFLGRGGGIRTHDPLLPKQMRYQAALRPDCSRFYRTTEPAAGSGGLLENEPAAVAAGDSDPT